MTDHRVTPGRSARQATHLRREAALETDDDLRVVWLLAKARAHEASAWLKGKPSAERLGAMLRTVLAYRGALGVDGGGLGRCHVQRSL